MDFIANSGKKVEIKTSTGIYLRNAIKTKFVTNKDNYISLVDEYVSGIYKEGDIVSISEKIISICQNRIIKREELKIGFWAKLLSKFASHPNTGIGVGESIKMQYAINKVGVLKVIFASFVSGITKLVGIKGMFYRIVGQEVSGLDGFYGHVWAEYTDIGIELPENPIKVCNEIKEKLGMSCMIVDSNDLGQEILGKSEDIALNYQELKELIKDNPAGQGKEQTPIILIRRK
ncbi:MAG: F420-0--gamma-glutamyl ligase [Clostridia bacterium]|nr:F420-0--gamma-glutamyl ligase [Clostridia bacterium]